MWAKYSEVKEGTKVHLDGGFTCVEEGPAIIEKDEHGLYFKCESGKHYLDGQWGPHGYVGLTIPT